MNVQAIVRSSGWVGGSGGFGVDGDAFGLIDLALEGELFLADGGQKIEAACLDGVDLALFDDSERGVEVVQFLVGAVGGGVHGFLSCLDLHPWQQSSQIMVRNPRSVLMICVAF